jgi:hypothetical protein
MKVSGRGGVADSTRPQNLKFFFDFEGGSAESEKVIIANSCANVSILRSPNALSPDHPSQKGKSRRPR